jgi:hypothetical protein
MPDPCVVDSCSINLGINADGALTADAILSAAACNALTCATGLLVAKHLAAYTEGLSPGPLTETYDGPTKAFVGTPDPTKGADVSVTWTNPSDCLSAIVFAIVLPGNDQYECVVGTRRVVDLRLNLLINAVPQDLTLSRVDSGSGAPGVTGSASVCPLISAITVAPSVGAIFRTFKDTVGVPTGGGPDYAHPNFSVGRSRLWVFGFSTN